VSLLLVLVGGAVVPVVHLLCDDVISGLGIDLFRCFGGGGGEEEDDQENSSSRRARLPNLIEYIEG
jgi:hypothetical protein